jgi:hypothetical protein
MYPADGSAPYVRSMDMLDMEMRVCVQDLGKDDQVCVLCVVCTHGLCLRFWCGRGEYLKIPVLRCVL